MDFFMLGEVACKKNGGKRVWEKFRNAVILNGYIG